MHDLPPHNGMTGSYHPRKYEEPDRACDRCGVYLYREDGPICRDASRHGVYCESCIDDLPACPLCEKPCASLWLGEHLTDDHGLTDEETDRIYKQMEVSHETQRN